MKLKAIFYDLDGTIIDTVPLHREAWRFAADKFGITFTPQMLLDQKGMAGDEFSRMVMKEGGMADRESEKKFLDIKIGYLAKNYSQARVFEGFMETYTELQKRGLKVLICTGMTERFVKMIPQLKSFEDNIVWREMYGHGKPAAEPLLVSAAKAQIDPGDCAYVGDAYNDYLAAKAAGMEFFYFDPPGSKVDPRLECVSNVLRCHADILNKI
jgi:phosphoglycolate phosphatase